jgi:thymidylate kinase
MVKNVLALVGFDNCGKTEIGKQLASIFDWTYFKNKNEGKKFESPDEARLGFKYEAQLMTNILEQFNTSIVMDRSIPCEYAYAKALNRSFDEDLVWLYDEKYANLGCKIIYCYKTKFEAFNDEWVTLELKKSVEKYYEEYLAKTKMRFCKVDTTSEDLVQEFSQIFKSGILFEETEDCKDCNACSHETECSEEINAN